MHDTAGGSKNHPFQSPRECKTLPVLEKSSAYAIACLQKAIQFLIFAAAAKGARGDEMIEDEVGWSFFDLVRMIVYMCGLWQIFRWTRRWLRYRTPTSTTATTATTSTTVTADATVIVESTAFVHEPRRRRHVNEANRIYIKEKGYAYHTYADCPTLQTRSSTMMRSFCRTCEAR